MGQPRNALGARGRRTLFAALFLFSGAAGLIYEQAWIRMLYQHFGSSIHSITTVVAAYMGGLGLGAFVMGRRADRHENPARLYGVLEIAIGVFGVLSPLVLGGIGSAYLAFARVLQPGLWVATFFKFIFAFIVMLVPTFLMGGTLPVLTRAFAAGRPDRYRRELALFYGLNTVGGVVGAALAGFVLIEHVGLTVSILATAGLNLLLGVAALAIARPDAAALDREDVGTSEHVAMPPVSSSDERQRRLALWIIGITAFASLLYEIAWTRVLVLVVGSSTYAFTTILVCFLLGIGLGSLFAVGKGLPPRDLLIRAGLIQGAIAVLASLLFPFFRALPVYIVAIFQVPFLSVTQILLLEGAALALVVIPPAVGMGLIFPVLAEVASTGTDAAGGDTGRSYFANTIGSILGAVVTGFVLIHTIGSERALVVGVLCNVGAAAGIAWWLYKSRGETGVMLPVERLPLVFGLLALVIAIGTPSWSSRLLDRGPSIYGHDRMSERELDGYLRGVGAEQLVFDEGWNAAISVWRNGGMTWLKTNGKTDASSVPDMDTQVGLALFPATAHPAPKRAFVIGFGSGVSVHTIASVPGIEHVDVAEIERAVLHAAPLFADVNGDVLSDPRVRVINDDARSALQLSKDTYDIIMSEPSNPWIAGVASLYTADYFAVAASRLNDDGIYAQWVQTYRVPASVVAVVVANFRRVFPHVEMYFSNGSDLILLGSRRPITWRFARVQAMLDPGSATGRAYRDWILVDRPSRLLGRFLLGEHGIDLLARSAPFKHSDDRPALEFVAARGLIVASGATPVFDSMTSIRALAGDTLPPLEGDWHLGRGEWQAAYGYELPTDVALARAMTDAALAADSTNPDFLRVAGRYWFARGTYRTAEPYLAAALRKLPDDPELLLLDGIAKNNLLLGSGRELLERVARAGGDSAYALSVLAGIDVDQRHWPLAQGEIIRALDAVRPSIARPFTAEMENTVRAFVYDAPVELAGPVLETARARRPSWDVAYWGGAEMYARWGGPHCSQAAALAEELPKKFGWTLPEAMGTLQRCAPRR